MADYNRNNNRFNRGGNGGGFKRGGFGDNRNSRGSVEMFQAVCDNCGKRCEVPFRPTNGKPVYCSDCFEKNRGSESRGQESRDYTPRREQTNNDGNNRQIEEINKKLDRILEILETAAEEAEYDTNEEDPEELVSEETQIEDVIEEAPKVKKEKKIKKTETQEVENI